MLLAGVEQRSTQTRNAASGRRTLDQELEELERALIVAALEASNGNQSRAAVQLGIGERRLRSRMERLGLVNRFRSP